MPGPYKRTALRRPVSGFAQGAQRTAALLGGRVADGIPCMILDASDSGYRIRLNVALPPGYVFTIEHADGTRCRVRLRWAKGGEAGVEILSRTPRRLR